MATITRTVLDEGFRAGIDVRVSLRADAGAGDSPFDGGWFPRSNDLAVELPELIAELDRRGVRVERFTYALEAWLPVPRKLVVQDRIVRTGGFRSMDPLVVCLTWDGGTTSRSARRRPPSQVRQTTSGSMLRKPPVRTIRSWTTSLRGTGSQASRA